MIHPLKICTVCKVAQSHKDFFKDKKKKDGLRSNCKECHYIWARTDKARAAHKIASKKWYLSGKGKASTKKCALKYENTPKGKHTRKQYQQSENGKISYTKSHKKYATSEKGKSVVLARNANRRAAKLQATPPWADKQLNKMFYKLSTYLTRVTGVPHDVDHIFPLQGENSCGLHVPWNLRVIPSYENESKGNKLP